jgi:hypothetical protein
MPNTFTVQFDDAGKIIQVTDAKGQVIPYTKFIELKDSPIPEVNGMTITEIYLTPTGCYIHHACRQVKVC